MGGVQLVQVNPLKPGTSWKKKTQRSPAHNLCEMQPHVFHQHFEKKIWLSWICLDFIGTSPVLYTKAQDCAHTHAHEAHCELCTTYWQQQRDICLLFELANSKTQPLSALLCDKCVSACVCFCAAPWVERRSARLPVPLAYTTKLPAQHYGGVDEAAQWQPSGHYEQQLCGAAQPGRWERWWISGHQRELRLCATAPLQQQQQQGGGPKGLFFTKRGKKTMCP